MLKRLSVIAILTAALGLAATATALAVPPGQNPNAFADTVICDGASVDIIVVGGPRAAEGSAGFGRPGIAFTPNDPATGVQVPKAITARVFVNDFLVDELSKAWGHGVTGLITCFETLQFTDQDGNEVRIELALEIMSTPRGQ